MPSPRTSALPHMPDDGDAVPAAVRAAIDGIVAVVDGSILDLRSVVLDERGIEPFRREVYAATRAILPGRTATYGEVAAAIGRSRRGARRRGRARPEPVPDPRPVPSGPRRERQAHRLLGARRPRDEAADARARGRPGVRPAGALRLTGHGRPTGPRSPRPSRWRPPDPRRRGRGRSRRVASVRLRKKKAEDQFKGKVCPCPTPDGVEL